VLTEDYRSAVRDAFEEVWNQGKVAVLDGLCAPTYLYHDPFRPDVRTLEDLKRYVTEVRSYFPDFHLTIEDLIGEGEQVVVRYTWRGTHTGDFVKPMPLPATGKQVTVTGIYMSRAVDGKAVEAWNVADNFGLLQQLGLLPVPQPVG
jgi:steroid delta-isomerase-like uncharacterized protein